MTAGRSAVSSATSIAGAGAAVGSAAGAASQQISGVGRSSADGHGYRESGGETVAKAAASDIGSRSGVRAWVADRWASGWRMTSIRPLPRPPVIASVPRPRRETRHTTRANRTSCATICFVATELAARPRDGHPRGPPSIRPGDDRRCVSRAPRAGAEGWGCRVWKSGSPPESELPTAFANLHATDFLSPFWCVQRTWSATYSRRHAAAASPSAPALAYSFRAMANA